MAEIDAMMEDLSELQKYIVLLLSAKNNEPIRGTTPFQMELLFQKELFLLAKNIEEVKSEASFASDFYGPYSETAKEELEALELDELVERKNNQISLTKTGLQIAKKLELSISKERVEMIVDFKELLNDLDDDELLTFIYFTFPEFTEESLVLEKIKKNRKKVALKLYKKEKISIQRAAEIANEPLENLIKETEK